MAEDGTTVADLSDSDPGDESQIKGTSGMDAIKDAKSTKDLNVEASRQKKREDSSCSVKYEQTVKASGANNNSGECTDHTDALRSGTVSGTSSNKERSLGKVDEVQLPKDSRTNEMERSSGKVNEEQSLKDSGTNRIEESSGKVNEEQSLKDSGTNKIGESSGKVDEEQSLKVSGAKNNRDKGLENVSDSQSVAKDSGDMSDYMEDVHLGDDSGRDEYTKQSSGYVDDWQSGKDFIQTNLMMLDSETLTDVTFKVGEEGEIIRAHRFMLASRSCVFFAMFCGQMVETSDILIADIEANTFRNLLRYLYTGVLALTADNALNLLYCSKKYCVKSLEQEVLEFCKSSICADNACLLLEQACLYSEGGLQEAAFDVITRDPDLVFVSEGFPKLSHANLDKLLDMDELAAREDLVFQAALVWAEEECLRQGKKAEMRTMREILGESLYKIRFPLMSQSEFVNLVGSKGILTDSERVRILESYISPTSSTHPFLKRPRNTGAKVYKIQRLVHGGVGYPLSRGSDALYISCNKSVKLLGIMLYSPANISTSAFSFFKSLLDSQNIVTGNSITFYITVVVRNASNVRIGIHHEDVDVTSEDTQLEILLSSPVNLATEERYTLSVLIEGSVRCWGVMNGMSRLTDPAGDVTWSFEHTPSKSCFDDSLKEGYISGLIYNLDQ